ncbi:unnamed protein product [Durusdinium trenchii]|uniref:Translation initiation factor beta propellor-like domain-containing protein n=1 Tax=Durusdinium trenchii TaxID=1381693 RepID=A0ABP0SWV7_9DINO
MLHVSLCHAVTGDHLAVVKLQATASIDDLYVASAQVLNRDTFVLHLLRHNQELSSGTVGQLAGAGEDIEISVLFVPGPRFVASAQSIWLLSIGTEPQMLKESTSESSSVLSMAFARKTNQIAIKTLDTVQVWDVISGELKEQLVVEMKSGRSASPSPKLMDFTEDGSQLAVIDDSQHVLKIWDLQSKACIFEAPSCFEVCAFSPDGLRIVAGGACDMDGTATVWQVSNSSCLQRLGLTDGYFTGALFSPDGSWIVTATREPNYEEVLLWDQAEHRALDLYGNYNVAFVSDSVLVGMTEDRGCINVVKVPEGRAVLSVPLEGTIRPHSLFAALFLPYKHGFVAILGSSENNALALTFPSLESTVPHNVISFSLEKTIEALA